MPLQSHNFILQLLQCTAVFPVVNLTRLYKLFLEVPSETGFPKRDLTGNRSMMCGSGIYTLSSDLLYVHVYIWKC